MPATPIHSSSWAEDVEHEAASPRRGPIEDTNSSLDWEAHPNYTRAPPNTAAASPDNLGLAKEATSPTESSGTKPRRNTLQSVSCSDPPLRPLQRSPSRSVSQPVPIIPVPSTPHVENVAPQTINEVQADSHEKLNSPKPAAIEAKASQEATRARGPRGRGHRGRYRGKGRRNPFNTKRNQNKRATNIPQSLPHTDSHLTSA
ncbi:hypothetical protein F5Y14DRAFT_7409 [Nemania sp. NC0429]|nr:hypothetical protein F5Y14DRAFT_7409 [Nemania sp. NC0429]